MWPLFIYPNCCKKNHFFFFAIIKKCQTNQQQQKKKEAKPAELRRIAVKKSNDELLNLKIILNKMEKLNAVWHQQIIEIDGIYDKIEEFN